MPALLERPQTEALPALPLAPAVPPMWRHQREILTMALRKRAAMIPITMGGGKSRIVVEYCKQITPQATLILCPKSVVPAWEKQFNLYAQGRFHVLPLQKGTLEKRTAQAREALDAGGPVVLVINYEAARLEPFATFAKQAAWDLVVADECHRLKSPTGSTAKFAHALTFKSERRLGLSGTPMAQTPLDIFSQYKFLDPKVFGWKWNQFFTRYAQTTAELVSLIRAEGERCWTEGEAVAEELGIDYRTLCRYRWRTAKSDGGYTYGQGVTQPFWRHEVFRLRNEDELRRKYESIVCDVPFDLDLPEVVHETLEVTLSDKAMRLYRDLEREFFAEVESGEVTAGNALTRLLRLQQVTSGHIKTDEGVVETVDLAKQQALAERLEDLPSDEPVVVFCKFKHDLQAIATAAKATGRTCGQLSGERNDLQAWQDGDLNVLATQLQAGGTGVDLTRARYCFWYSTGFSLSDYLQSQARCHRPGQTRTCFFYTLVVPGTIDAKVYAALQGRRDVIEAILAGGR